MEFNREKAFAKSTATQSVVWDEGLRAYMLKVYNYGFHITTLRLERCIHYLLLAPDLNYQSKRLHQSKHLNQSLTSMDI